MLNEPYTQLRKPQKRTRHHKAISFLRCFILVWIPNVRDLKKMPPVTCYIARQRKRPVSHHSCGIEVISNRFRGYQGEKQIDHRYQYTMYRGRCGVLHRIYRVDISPAQKTNVIGGCRVSNNWMGAPLAMVSKIIPANTSSSRKKQVFATVYQRLSWSASFQVCSY